MLDVFISHARADAEFARRMRAHLTGCGISVWTDEEDLEPGTQLVKAVDEAIGRSRNVVFLLSDNANSSHFLRTEAAIAVAKGGKRLIPIRCSKRAEVPFILRSFAALDLSNASNQRAHLDRLADLLRSDLPDTESEIRHGNAIREHVLRVEAEQLSAEKARHEKHSRQANRILRSRLAGVAALAATCTAAVGAVTSLIAEPHTIVAAVVGATAGLVAALIFDAIRSVRLAERSE